MSVRVNLLPEATRSQDRANQQRLIAGAAMLALFAVLGGVWWWSAGQVRDAEDRLAVAQLVSGELRSDEAELVSFRDLDTRRGRADEILITALGGEVSIAGVLQDLAAVMPEDVQFDQLAVTLQPPSEARTDLLGSLSLTGRTVSDHAPGVEGLLREIDKIATFGELFLNSSSLDPAAEDPIVTFVVDGAIRVEGRTGRYDDGVGEVRR